MPEIRTDAYKPHTGRDAGLVIYAMVQGAIKGLSGGPVIAAVQAILEGLAALTDALCAAKVNRIEAVAWARSLDLPDPDEVPYFIVKVANMTFAERHRTMVDLQRDLERTKSDKAAYKIKTRIAIVGLLISREWLVQHNGEIARVLRQQIKAGKNVKQAQAQLAQVAAMTPEPPAPALVLAARYSPWTPYVVGGMLLATAGVVLLG